MRITTYQQLIATLLLVLLGAGPLAAQTPQGINYQAVARNSNGEVIANQAIGVRFSVLANGPNGTVVYQETHSPTTNAQGLFSLVIGQGTPTQGGSLQSVDWAANTKFLRVEVDEAGGSDYSVLSTTQLQSVPYAQVADTALNVAAAGDDWGSQAAQVQGPELAGDGTGANPISMAGQSANSGQVLQWNGTDWVPATVSGGTGDNWGTQVAQTGAAISGDGTASNPLNIAQQSAASGEVLQWNGNSWVPATDDNTTYSAGNGLAMSGTTFNLAQQGATSGQVLQWNGSSWAPATVSGGGTVTTTSALTGNGSSGSPLGLAQQSATSGQVLQWNGNSWVPATDDNTTYSAGNGLAMSGTTFNLAQQGATNGQVLQWNGSSWAPASDDSTDNDWSGAGTGALTLGNSGDKVGIGTTSPSAKFQLEGGNADLVDAELTTLTTGGDTLVSITDTNSVGQVQTYAPNNSTNVAIGSVGGSPGALDHGLVAVADASGAGKGILFAQPMNGGAGELNLLDANGDQLASMSALGTAGQNGQITLFDDGGLGRAQLLSSANAGGAGQLTLLHANGNTGMLLGDAFNDNTQNAAQFVMLDSTGATKLFTGTAQSPAGGFAFANYINASNNRGVYIGTSNANNNEGAVALYDSSGAYHGGLIFNNSNQLQTVADVKNFRMQHPTQSDKAIWYASLEGPEAAAYDRGTAQLQNGTAVIELPDHFQHVASQQNLTVHLTPLSAQSQGLAAVEKGTDRIVVRELRNGQGNYKFDWEVKAVRKGFQDYQVVREQKRYAPAPPRPQQPHSLQQ